MSQSHVSTTRYDLKALEQNQEFPRSLVLTFTFFDSPTFKIGAITIRLMHDKIK